MKKQLLATSAIALGVAAAPASAQDWNLDWGGFFSSHIGYADVGGNNAAVLGAGNDFDGIQMATNAEIIFTPSITLDNGLTFGVNVQLETTNNAIPSSGGATTQIDESYMSISGDSFGRVDIGFENSAGYKMMTGAPSVGSFAINSGSQSMFLPYANVNPAPGPGPRGGQFRNAYGSTATEVAANNDVMRISYYTPSFNGLTVGVSYAPSAAGNVRNIAPVNRGNNNGLVDIFDIGVNYSQSFGTTDVTVAARWGTADNTSTVVGTGDPETWGIGAQVGFNGITVGGAYAENDSGATSQIGDAEGWSFGVSYDVPGPWTVGLEAFQGEQIVNAALNKDKLEVYKLAASRNLGPGVSWDLFLLMAETKETAGNTKTDATVVGTSLNLNF